MEKIIVIFSLLVSTLALTCQQKGSLDNDSAIESFPFRFTEHNNIVVQGIVNTDDTLDMMFHTAANDISILSSVAKNMSSLKWGAKEDVKNGSI